MRRKDREMDRGFGLSVIDSSTYSTLSLVDNNEVYSVILSVVRDNDNLYFHSAKKGTKVELFKENKDVTLTFVSYTNIPENYSFQELDKIVEDKNKLITLISKVFTTEFKSAIVKGEISLVEDRKEKEKALRLICEKYTKDKMKYFKYAIEAGLDKTNIYKIKIKDITSKRKKYNKDGIEMKYMRSN